MPEIAASVSYEDGVTVKFRDTERMPRPKNTKPQVSVFLDPRGSGLYLARWRDPATGKRILRGTGKATEQDAWGEVEAILAKFYNPAPTDGWRVRDLLDAYIKARTQEDHSKTFKHNLTHVHTYFGGFTPDQRNDVAFKGYRRYRCASAPVIDPATPRAAPSLPSRSTTLRLA